MIYKDPITVIVCNWETFSPTRHHLTFYIVYKFSDAHLLWVIYFELSGKKKNKPKEFFKISNVDVGSRTNSGGGKKQLNLVN